ncbi:MAG: NifU family protein [Sphingomonadales bacterium]|nr:NifU family protein [Sphingomonadales bacterium]
MSEPVTFYSESTPNPSTMKFVANRYLLETGWVEVDRHSPELQEVPLAVKLFEFPFVERVYISQNFVTITRLSHEDWLEINPILKEFIQSYVEAGLPVTRTVRPEVANIDVEGGVEGDGETPQRIRQILREYIQPAVEQDGGAIRYKSWDPITGIVSVTLQGSCSGCPSSTITLKAGIENLLKRMLPEVKEVVADV